MQTISKQIRILLPMVLCLLAGCIPEGDETVALETGNAEAEQMILGKWVLASKTSVDDDGKERPLEMGKEDPSIEFLEEGKYLFSFPDGKETSGNWSLNKDSYTLKLGSGNYEIYSLGKKILVLIIKVEDFYIKYVYHKQASPPPAEKEGDEPGGTTDKNPYTGWKKPDGTNIEVSRVAKIELSHNGAKATVYTFNYDARGRIIKYTTPEDTYTFVYDDEKVYLKCNGKLMNTGAINAQGYLSKLWNGDENSANISTFTYNSNRLLTKLVNTTTSWEPRYSGSGIYACMISPFKDNSQLFKYESHHEFGNLLASVDLNGFISSCYQWEWFMHSGKPEIVLGLFDFYGKRSARMLSEETTSQWKNVFTTTYSRERVKSVSQVRTGLNTNFQRKYTIFYTDEQ